MSQSPGSPCEAARQVIDRIKAEHLLLARIIAAMQAWVAQRREPGKAPDMELFRAMLRYVEEVPDRIHHPQEDKLLFPAMASLPGARQLIAELENEHARGADMLRSLHLASDALQAGAPNAINQLSTAVDEFSEFYWAHMRKEEQSLLPLAASNLTQPQWERIERSFVVVNDPLFGVGPAQPYRQLYDYIAARLSEPLKGFVEAAAVLPRH